MTIKDSIKEMEPKKRNIWIIAIATLVILFVTLIGSMSAPTFEEDLEKATGTDWAITEQYRVENQEVIIYSSLNAESYIVLFVEDGVTVEIEASYSYRLTPAQMQELDNAIYEHYHMQMESTGDFY